MRMLVAALTDGDKRPTVTTKDPADKVKGPYDNRSGNNIVCRTMTNQARMNDHATKKLEDQMKRDLTAM
jgi:hypothetical protein